ncbi:hypothetical protein EV175_005703, partial [Coemansia sp. RSA 1933]
MAMPKLYDIGICDYGVVKKPRHKWKADKFLSAIFTKARTLNVKVDSVNLASDYLFLQNGTYLAHLELYAYKKNLFRESLLVKCAPALLSLKLYDERLQNARSLIFDENDEPIIYPQL